MARIKRNNADQGIYEPDLTTFGGRLMHARVQKKLSQLSLAKLVGLAQPTIFHLENRDESSRHTITLARILGVNPEWLASGKGPMRKTVTAPMIETAAEAIHEHARKGKKTLDAARDVARTILDAALGNGNGTEQPKEEAA
jgi:DNA-binding XRE family transcriptional regulator